MYSPSKLFNKVGKKRRRGYLFLFPLISELASRGEGESKLLGDGLFIRQVKRGEREKKREKRGFLLNKNIKEHSAEKKGEKVCLSSGQEEPSSSTQPAGGRGGVR